MRTVLLTLPTFALAVVAGAAPAEPQKSAGSEDLAAVDDQSVLLIRDPTVRAELGLTDAQIEAVQAVTDEADGPLWAMRDAPPEKGRKALLGLLTRTNDALARVLEPAQKRRLDQIVLQVQGTPAVARPDVADKLALTNDQHRRVATIIEETQASLRKASKQARTPESRSTVEKTFQQLHVKQHRRIVSVLTNEQKRQWLSLVGSPFDLTKVSPPAMKAPELQPVEAWINSKPLTLAQLRGKVVVVHFWTFGCINCIHNYGAYKDWQERFADKDFSIIGIHTPESRGEKNIETIRQKAKANGLAFAVAVDNEKRNWDAWTNHVWPAVYLLDK